MITIVRDGLDQASRPSLHVLGYSMTKQNEAPKKPTLHYIFYIDGGAQPNPGYGGYGIHGYAHDRIIAKQGQGAKVTPSINGYLRKKDGSQEINVHHYVDGWGSLGYPVTNNYAELVSLQKTLIFVTNRLHDETIQSVTIFADSEYLVKGINERLEQWSAQQWRKSDGTLVAHDQLWQKINDLYRKLQKELSITVDWVRGHDGDMGNQISDIHATKGVIVSRKEMDEQYLQVSDAKGYWQCKCELHRLLCKSHWYFLTNQQNNYSRDGRVVYHTGNHGSDDNLIGKKIAEASFGIVFCQTPVQPLEAIRCEQHNQENDTDKRFIIARLSTIRQPKYAQQLSEDGGKYLQCDVHHHSLLHADGTQLTKVMRPARLAFRAVETLTSIESLLEYHLDPESSPIRIINTDITDLIFDKQINAKGKEVVKLQNTIQPTSKSIEIDIRYQTQSDIQSIPVRLCFDMDLPSRNALSALTSQSPTIYALTWRESDRSFRFASVVHVGSDVGLYTSYYANLILLNR